MCSSSVGPCGVWPVVPVDECDHSSPVPCLPRLIWRERRHKGTLCMTSTGWKLASGLSKCQGMSSWSTANPSTSTEWTSTRMLMLVCLHGALALVVVVGQSHVPLHCMYICAVWPIGVVCLWCVWTTCVVDPREGIWLPHLSQGRVCDEVDGSERHSHQSLPLRHRVPGHVWRSGHCSHWREHSSRTEDVS